jgi:hypothetical protein
MRTLRPRTFARFSLLSWRAILTDGWIETEFRQISQPFAGDFVAPFGGTPSRG